LHFNGEVKVNIVRMGDRVVINYTGRFLDGRSFSEKRERETISFVAGDDSVFPGLSQAVIMMKPGDVKSVIITPENGYGYRDENLVMQIPSSLFPKGIEIGEMVTVIEKDRKQLTYVTGIDDDRIELDANHPLAGKTILFEIELVDREPAERAR